ncbi:hypothetical protein ACWEO2_28465 [Nocardia sp. NPDC004278]
MNDNGIGVWMVMASVALAGWGSMGVFRGGAGGTARTVVAVGSVVGYCVVVVGCEGSAVLPTGCAAAVLSSIWLVSAYAMTDPTPDATAGILVGSAAMLFGGSLVLSGIDTSSGAMASGTGMAVCAGAAIPYVNIAIARGIACCGLGTAWLALGLAGSVQDYLVFDIGLITGGGLLVLVATYAILLAPDRSYVTSGQVGYVGMPQEKTIPEWKWRVQVSIAGFVGAALGCALVLCGIQGIHAHTVGMVLIDDVLAEPAGPIGFGFSGTVAQLLQISLLAASALVWSWAALGVGVWSLVGGIADLAKADSPR